MKKIFSLVAAVLFAGSMMAQVTTCAPDPTLPEAQVLSIYSDAYTSTTNWGHCESWGQSTTLTDATCSEGNNILSYANFNYLGWAAASPVNAADMEKLHVDIYAAQAGSIGIVPIYGGSGLKTDDSHRYTATLVAGWNTIDIDLATDLAGLNLSSIFQFKFDQGVTCTEFSIDNLYFYTTQTGASIKSVNTIANLKECQAAGVLKDGDTITVKGYIVNMFAKPGNFAKYGSVCIWLTDTLGGATKEFELYNCYAEGHDTLAYFGPNYTTTGTSNVDMDTVISRLGHKYVKGDLIEATGTFKLYNTTYELNSGCEITKGGAQVRPMVGEDIFNAAAASVSSTYIAPGWSVDAASSATYADGAISVNIVNGLGAQWQGQVKFDLGMDFAADNEYMVACKFNSNKAVGGVTFKMLDSDNAAYIFVNKQFDIPAAEFDYVSPVFAGAAENPNHILVFDFGWAAAATQITISDIAVYHISGTLPEEPGTAVDNVEAVEMQKIIRNGQLIIIRDGVEYNALGQRL